jgi:hypothetical protein
MISAILRDPVEPIRHVSGTAAFTGEAGKARTLRVRNWGALFRPRMAGHNQQTGHADVDSFIIFISARPMSW